MSVDWDGRAHPFVLNLVYASRTRRTEAHLDEAARIALIAPGILLVVARAAG